MKRAVAIDAGTLTNEEMAKAVAEMKTLLNKIPDEEILRSIRESRDKL